MSELSHELQEKARKYQTIGELDALLAENDVELSEDALEAFVGGCTSTSAETSLTPLETMIQIAKDNIAGLKSLIDIQKELAINRLI